MTYVGLTSQIETWFKSPSMCLKLAYPLLGGNKERWFYRNGPSPLYNQLFDGSRWSDYSYFFDPNQQFLLPAKCTNTKCSFIFSTQHLLEQQEQDEVPDGQVMLK